MTFKWMTTTAVCLVMAGVASGAKFKDTGMTGFPRVGEDGMLLTVDPQALQTTLIVNTKNGKGRVVAKGQVQNLSGVKQKYQNSDVLLGVLGLPNPLITDVIKSLYKVSASGAARAKLAIQVDLAVLAAG